MLSRISAEFESMDMAELVVGRVKQSVSGVLRTGIIHNREAERAEKLAHGESYTLLPTAVTTHNYITATLISETTDSILEEPQRSKNSKLYIICEKESLKDVSSILNAMGGLKIHSSET